MWSKVVKAVKAFRWPQWLALALFLLFISLSAFKTVNTVRQVGHWRTHRDEPIKGWMTVNYVAHSYHVPPHVLYQALGLPDKPRDRRTLRAIAKSQQRSIDEVRAVLQDAINQARPPHPSPLPSPDQGGIR